MDLPVTLGALQSESGRFRSRSVKEEIRENLIARLRTGETLFPGVQGYEETVVPQVVNALLSRHNFILLGLRGQAKTRLIRMLTGLLDEWTPYVEGSEIRDNPFEPLSKFAKDRIAQMGDDTPIAWLHRDQRYVEKLATPDVTIADMIGDIDPIKAARSGNNISDELTVHYGLLPRANRGIFAVNELPDLAGKIQVGLFNIMQEGDVQIKGYPVRLPLDVLLVFTANPEDYTARGKIVTPLKDRIGSEIRTHYPLTVDQGIQITAQEAWAEKRGGLNAPQVKVPKFIREIVENIAFLAREDKKVDKRSGVSQRLPISVLENVVSNAERRALRNSEDLAVPRVLDLYAALPAITGKIELEYEGELKGGDTVARELVRAAVGRVFTSYYDGVNLNAIVQYFDLGGALRVDASSTSADVAQQLGLIQGLLEKTRALGLTSNEPDAMRAAAGEFILEGLYAHRRVSRNEELGFVADERKQRGGGYDEDEEPQQTSSAKRRRQFN
ncbi:magnesium chelatase [Bryobacterales bacterium F-183]|nr:magnesium chelatase [Bryobacterales bacterium F-183]